MHSYAGGVSVWEALYMGVIPIVLSSLAEDLPKGLPVLPVKSWEDVTEELLLASLKFKHQLPNFLSLEALFLPYWAKKVTSIKSIRSGTMSVGLISDLL